MHMKGGICEAIKCAGGDSAECIYGPSIVAPELLEANESRDPRTQGHGEQRLVENRHQIYTTATSLLVYHKQGLAWGNQVAAKWVGVCVCVCVGRGHGPIR